MKLRTGIRLLLLCLTLFLVLSGCGEETPPETAPTVTEPIVELTPQEKYTLSREQLYTVPELTATVTYTKTRQVNGELYSEKMTSIMSCRDVGTSQVAAAVKQDVSFGNYTTQYAEYFKAGSAYCAVSGSYFQNKNMTWKDFTARQLPLGLLDAGLYSSVAVEETEEGQTKLLFTGASKLESWVCSEANAVLLSASGTALMDAEGNLLQTTYTAQYSLDETVYQIDVTSNISKGVVVTLDADLSAIPASCPAINYFDAPRKLLQVVGDVYTSQSMTVKYTESLYSAAYARRRSQTSTFDTYGIGADFMARSMYEVTLLDYSNTADVNSEVVTFLDGSCVSSINGAEGVVRPNITAQQMREYCEDSILAALFTPNHILDAEVSDNGEFLTIRFTGNDAFVDKLCTSIYSMFGANLDHYAESFTTPTASGYLCISKRTGLPTALGISLSRIHVIDGVSCPLNYQLDQMMQLSSATAYETITGSPLPGNTTNETASPLFYKVTNEEGKTMWLMGTITVGDHRATRLPEVIYNAFAESAALAVEFDIQTFEQSVLSDPELQAKLSEAYYYSDGSLLAHHLDAQLLQKLQDMILISGSNNTNAQNYRAVIWWNLLNDFYLRQDPELSADMAIDKILLEMAYASEKPVLEIENGLTGIQTLAGFSDELQALLLRELLQKSTYSYSQEIRQEYESWCKGDEEALLNNILTEPEDLSEEEKLLLEEYREAMYTDRNAKMLRKALEYLKGEDTVFFAVGYAHLLGETGLLQGLQDAGYTVELVSYE